jgi:hypothetical protein
MANELRLAFVTTMVREFVPPLAFVTVPVSTRSPEVFEMTPVKS